VSWFGIVRGISSAEQDPNKYSLLLEQEYFDGPTDCHIMLVAATGSGDFRATLEGRAESIPFLVSFEYAVRWSQKKTRCCWSPSNICGSGRG
jgi:hypothetical protein